MQVIRIPVPVPDNPCPLAEYTRQQWKSDISQPLTLAIQSAQEALFPLLGDGGGSILFAISANPGPAWSMVVSGVYGLARSIAKEYGRRHIRCNVLVGESDECEDLLAKNEAITGEILFVGGKCRSLRI